MLVLGLSIQDSFDINVLRLVVSDPELTETLFIERGIPFVVNEIVVVRFTEGVPSLSSCLSALSSAETNIHTSYPLFVNQEGWPLIALSVEDPDFATSILRPQLFDPASLRPHFCDSVFATYFLRFDSTSLLERYFLDWRA